MLTHTVLAYTDMTELIAENQHTAQLFHCLRYGRNGILDRLHQLLDRRFQFTGQSIVCLDLTVDFTAVRDDALFLQGTGNHTLMNGGLCGGQCARRVRIAPDSVWSRPPTPYATPQAVHRCSNAQQWDSVCQTWCFSGACLLVHSRASPLRTAAYTLSFARPCTVICE